VKAPSFQDGHPGNSDPLSEQAFLVQVINALQGSSEWESTAVIIAWDDSDGWFDHVTGPIVNASAQPGADFFAAGLNCGTPAAGAFQGRCGYGPRLPLLVVSPFAKENHVDHNVTDQSSLLRFIEDNWHTGQIDATLPPKGQGSFDRLAGSIEGMFDFVHPRSDRMLILDASTGQPVDRHGGDDDDHGGRDGHAER
jgi:phospholipase C